MDLFIPGDRRPLGPIGRPAGRPPAGEVECFCAEKVKISNNKPQKCLRKNVGLRESQFDWMDLLYGNSFENEFFRKNVKPIVNTWHVTCRCYKVTSKLLVSNWYDFRWVMSFGGFIFYYAVFFMAFMNRPFSMTTSVSEAPKKAIV